MLILFSMFNFTFMLFKCTGPAQGIPHMSNAKTVGTNCNKIFEYNLWTYKDYIHKYNNVRLVQWKGGGG